MIYKKIEIKNWTQRGEKWITKLGDKHSRKNRWENLVLKSFSGKLRREIKCFKVCQNVCNKPEKIAWQQIEKKEG